MNRHLQSISNLREKQKATDQELLPFERWATLHEPTISVSTKKVGDTIKISVADNGNDYPQKVVAKIFQPFFTTKPTGQGTGLGLSLAYDIVKAHGGEIKVETKVDEENPDHFGKGDGSDFEIQLSVV